MTVSIGTAERFDKAQFTNERAFVEHVLGILQLEWRKRNVHGMRIIDAEWIKGPSPVLSLTTGSAKGTLSAADVSAFIAEKKRNEKQTSSRALSLREEEERRLAGNADA